MNQLIKIIGIINLFLAGVWLAYPAWGFFIMASFSLLLIFITHIQSKSDFSFIDRWVKDGKYQNTRIGFTAKIGR